MTPVVPGRAGAALAPGGAADTVPPSIAFQMAYTLLFTRTTASGVAVRAYSADSSNGDGCPAPDCVPPTTPPGTPPCPAGAMCAEPVITPHAANGSSGSSGAAVTPGPANPTVTTGASGSTPAPTASCGQLVVELSTDRAVSTGTTALPTTPPTASDPIEVLGSGSFGVAEGAPVSWVAVWVGSGVTTVQLSLGGHSVDAMAPHEGVVVLAAPGDSGVAAASVIGLGPDGATVGTAPALPSQAAGAGSCTSTTSTTSTTSAPRLRL